MHAQKPLTIGERIYLRKVEVTDAEGPYHKWMNDPEITKYLESRFSKNTKKDLRDFIKNAQKNKDVLFLAIISKGNHRHIGNIKLGPINWIHKTADVGVMIGEKEYWGKGMATEAIKLLVEYAFKKLKLHKLTAGCYSGNTGSIKAFLKAGFEEEGTRKSQYICKGKYVDGILFGKINPYEGE